MFEYFKIYTSLIFYTKIIYTNNDLYMPRRGPEKYTRVDFGRLRECMASMEPLMRFPDPPVGTNREEWKKFFDDHAKQIFAWMHCHPGSTAARPRISQRVVTIRAAMVFLRTWYNKNDDAPLTFYGIYETLLKLVWRNYDGPIPPKPAFTAQLRAVAENMRDVARKDTRPGDFTIPEFMMIKHFVDVYDSCVYLHGPAVIKKPSVQPAQPAQPAPAQPAQPDLSAAITEMKRQRDEMVEEMRAMKRQHAETLEEFKKLRNEMHEHATRSQFAPYPSYGYPPPYYHPYYAYGNPAAPPTPRSDGM